MLDKLDQIEQTNPMPHYPKDLQLEMKEALLWTKHECDEGNCSTCLKNKCQIKEFRRELSKIKPSFCPGDYTNCQRANVQGCRKCRREHLDFGTRDTIVHPQKILLRETHSKRNKEIPEWHPTKEEIRELEALEVVM